MTKLKPTLLEALDEFPPKLCRIIARDLDNWRRPLTNRDIAQRSGLTEKQVSRISRMTTWATLTVHEVDAFRTGCGITPLNIKLHRQYVRRTFNPSVTSTPMAHLERGMLHPKLLRSLLKQ